MQLWAIAANTYRENIRDRVLYSIVFFAVLVHRAAPAVRCIDTVPGDEHPDAPNPTVPDVESTATRTWRSASSMAGGSAGCSAVRPRQHGTSSA